jgi:hypothetical protein
MPSPRHPQSPIALATPQRVTVRLVAT